jgi:hypothetical protein
MRRRWYGDDPEDHSPRTKAVGFLWMAAGVTGGVLLQLVYAAVTGASVAEVTRLYITIPTILAALGLSAFFHRQSQQGHREEP